MAWAEAPLSAIDWLDDVPNTQAVALPVTRDKPAPADVTITPLGPPDAAAVGLVSAETSGLGTDIWEGADGELLARQLRRLSHARLPAVQDLVATLVLAEALPPAQGAAAFTQARIDTLVTRGAVDPARALLQALGPRRDPSYLSQYADLSLLAGDEADACSVKTGAPHLNPRIGWSIFCAARQGRWADAALLFGAADALGMMEDAEAAALLGFLDPELVAEDVIPPPPRRPSALIFTLYEALGQRLPTSTLPRAYAYADLNGRAGWKAQLEAAERLATEGAISPNRLYGFYLRGRASASGGVWDRVSAVQAVRRAIETGDEIGEPLARLWTLARRARLEVQMARIFGPQLLEVDAPEAFPFVALSGDGATSKTAGGTDMQRALMVLGALPAEGEDALETAILAAFNAPVTSTPPTGPALITAAQKLEHGAKGDGPALTEGLVSLRQMGFATLARQAALQVLLIR